MQRKIWRYLAAYLLPLGCVEQTWDEAVPHLTGASTTTSDTTSSLPTTTNYDPGDPAQTVTGASEETDTTSAGSSSTPTVTDTTSGPTANEPPTIEDFWADPDQLSEAGKSQLHLKMSADVVNVRLYQNDDLLGVLTPGQFPYTYEALSAKYNLNHHFVVEVEDAEGLTAMDDLWLNVLLPKSGDERCIFKDQNMGAESSSIAALVYAEDAIVAVGWRDTGAGQRMAIWKLGKATCEVLDGWPRTIANWNPELAMETSRAVGVAIDENGYIALAANLWTGDGPQPYVALLTPEGASIWERPGDVGEEAAGIAAGPQDRVFVVGARRTSENPIRTDAMVWGYQRFDNDQVVVWEDSLKAPFTPDEQEPDVENLFSERAHGVMVWGGDVFVVGERDFKDDFFLEYTRTFISRYETYGARIEPIWTSPGDYFKHEGMTSIALCGSQLIVGGWSRAEFPDSVPVPLMRWIEADGTSMELHGEPLPSSQTFGIACDREEKIVSGGTRWSGQFDAHVFASVDPKKPPIIYDTGDASQDGVFAMACDAEDGFCAAGGFRSAGLAFAVVRVYHP